MLERRRMWDGMRANGAERALNGQDSAILPGGSRDQECSKWSRGTPMIQEGERVAGRALKKQDSAE